MELKVEDDGPIRVVRVQADRLDAAVAVRFKDLFADQIAEGVEHYVLDLSRVEFLDSSGLGAVVAVLKLLGGRARLHLAGLQPLVAKVFQLTRMDSVFAILPDAKTALNGLKAA